MSSANLDNPRIKLHQNEIMQSELAKIGYRNEIAI